MVEIRQLRLDADSTPLRRAVDRARASLNEFGRSALGAGRNVDTLDDRARRSARGLSVLRSAVFGVFGGVGIVQSIRQTTQLLSEFEKQSIVVGQVAGANAREFSALEDASRRLGATTIFTATQAAEAQVELARKGFEVNEILSATPAILDLASASQIDLARSADIASTVMRQFGLDTTQTRDVVDSFTIISNRTAATTERLARAFTDAGVNAATVGESVETVVASLGVLADRQIRGERAGVALRQIFLQLANPSSAAQKEIRRLRLEVEDLDPAANSLTDILERLGESEFSLASAARIFGDRQAVAGQILVQNVAQVRSLREEILENRGETERFAREIEDSLFGAFRELNSAIQETVLNLGEQGLRGGLENVFGVLTDALRQINGITARVTEFGTAAEITSLVLVGGLTRGIIAATRATIAFTVALARNPFGLVATGVSTAVAALVVYRNRTIEIGERTLQVSDVIVAAYEKIRDTAIFVFTGVELAITKFNSAAELGFLALKDTALAVYDEIRIGALVLERETIGQVQRTAIDAQIAGIRSEAKRREIELGKIANGQLEFIENLEQEFAAQAGRAARSILDRAGDRAAERQIAQRPGIEAAVEVAKTAFVTLGTFGAGELDRLTGAGEKVESILGDSAEEAEKLREAAMKAVAALKDLFDAQGFELSTIGLTNEERRKELDLLKLRELAVDAGIKDSTALEEAYARTADRIISLNRAQELGGTVARTIGESIKDVIKDFDNFGESLKNFALRLSDVLLETLAIQPLVQSLTGVAGGTNGASGLAGFFANIFSFAKGGGFSLGSIVPMQLGEVIDKPTFRPLGGNRTALMGEAGTEVVMPAKRMSNGELGVAVAGGAGSGATFNITVNAQTAGEGVNESVRQAQRRLRKMV